MDLRTLVDQELRRTSFSSPDVAEKMIAALHQVLGIGFDARAVTLGASKVGGRPHLPAGVAWPEEDGEPLAFLAQINFAECKPFDFSQLLPDNGILYFFCSSDESMLSDPQPPSRLVFHPGTTAGLAPAAFPYSLDVTEGRLVERHIRFGPSFIQASEHNSGWMGGARQPGFIRFDKRDEDKLVKVLAEAGCVDGPWMLGRPFFYEPDYYQTVDPKKDALILSLTGGSLWRAEDDRRSVFTGKRFNLLIGKAALVERKFQDAWLIVD